MAHAEKEPENRPEFQKAPDDLPPEAAELVEDIDSYQKKMESEWETAKSAYEEKINRIMDEFLSANNVSPNTAEQPPQSPPPGPRKKYSSNNDPLKDLMSQVEAELRRSDASSKRSAFMQTHRPESLQLGWKDEGNLSTRRVWWAVGGIGTIVVSAIFYWMFWRVTTIPLPYSHTMGPILLNDRVYIFDWFRRSLYVHEDKNGFPIRSVETVPNTLASGMALSAKILWSLDSLDKKILLHATSPDHQVTSSFSTPGEKPVGLYYDGTDLWSADLAEKQLYRHHGNDVEDIRDRFPLPDLTLTSFTFRKSRLWILDGKSRLINVYRLQKPMAQIGSFDLDPFLKGASPTGFAIDGRKLVLVTENPSVLIRIPIERLRKSTTDSL